MAKIKKYYVVWAGIDPGIYDSWEKCQLQIKAYPNAKYKSFKTLADAKTAFAGKYEDHITKTSKATSGLNEVSKRHIIWDSIAVDAACSGNPGDMEYRGVDTETKQEIFRRGVFKEGTNNIGEFLALVHALALLKKTGKTKKLIYTDSRTAMSWVRNKKVKTTLVETKKNEALFQLIDRAIQWVKENPVENPIQKWETKKWGEIPADFGRK